MQTNTINLTDEAIKAINDLQHPCGTYDYYRAALNRIFTYVLHCSDEIGMSDTEAVATLRALDDLRSDLAAIAGPAAQQQYAADTKELMWPIENMLPGSKVEANEGNDDAGATDTDR